MAPRSSEADAPLQRRRLLRNLTNGSDGVISDEVSDDTPSVPSTLSTASNRYVLGEERWTEPIAPPIAATILLPRLW